MSAPPNRTDLAGTPTVATYKLAIGALYDYVASLLGNGTATIASDSEKKLARESLGVGQFGLKNKLINGSFLIDQRNSGNASTITAGAAIKYTLDRWYASCTGANISVQQVAGIALQAKSARLTGASGCTGTLFGQRIESVNSVDLKNQNVTTSLFIKSSSARVVTWSAYYANSVNNFSAKTLINSGTINATTTADFFSFNFNAGSNASNGIAIEFSTGALGVGETIIYDQIQHEKSNIATEFQSESIQQELANCQRYYQFGTARFDGAGVNSGIGITASVYFCVEMRSSPSMTQTHLEGGGFGTVPAISWVSSKGYGDYRFSATSGSGYFVTSYTASAEL